MIRVSYFEYRPNKINALILHHLCYASRKLWNVANFERRNWTKDSGVPYPDWYEQKKRLKDHFWYKHLLFFASEKCRRLQRKIHRLAAYFLH